MRQGQSLIHIHLKSGDQYIEGSGRPDQWLNWPSNRQGEVLLEFLLPKKLAFDKGENYSLTQ
jgi:hypothetical protein